MVQKLLWPITALLWLLIVLSTISLLIQIDEPVPMILGWGITIVSEDMGDAIPAGTIITVNKTDSYGQDDILVCQDSEKNLSLHHLSSVSEDVTVLGKVVHQFQGLESEFRAISDFFSGMLHGIHQLLSAILNAIFPGVKI